MNIENSNKKYKSDGKFIFSCMYHVIFCTKYRRKVLTENVIKRMKELIIEKQQEYKYELVDQEIMEDHVHLILDVNPKIGIYTIVSNIKGYTANILRKEFHELKTKLPCLWSSSRFISSVGSVSLEVVKKYIENQKNV